MRPARVRRHQHRPSGDKTRSTISAWASERSGKVPRCRSSSTNGMHRPLAPRRLGLRHVAAFHHQA